MRKPRPLLRHAGKAAIDTKQRRLTVTVVRGRLEKPQGGSDRGTPRGSHYNQSADIIKKYCFRLITTLLKAQDHGGITLSQWSQLESLEQWQTSREQVTKFENGATYLVRVKIYSVSDKGYFCKGKVNRGPHFRKKCTFWRNEYPIQPRWIMNSQIGGFLMQW